MCILTKEKEFWSNRESSVLAIAIGYDNCIINELEWFPCVKIGISTWKINRQKWLTRLMLCVPLCNSFQEIFACTTEIWPKNHSCRQFIQVAFVYKLRSLIFLHGFIVPNDLNNATLNSFHLHIYFYCIQFSSPSWYDMWIFVRYKTGR